MRIHSPLSARHDHPWELLLAALFPYTYVPVCIWQDHTCTRAAVVMGWWMGCLSACAGLWWCRGKVYKCHPQDLERERTWPMVPNSLAAQPWVAYQWFRVLKNCCFMLGCFVWGTTLRALQYSLHLQLLLKTDVGCTPNSYSISANQIIGYKATVWMAAQSPAQFTLNQVQRQACTMWFVAPDASSLPDTMLHLVLNQQLHLTPGAVNHIVHT